MFSVIFHFFAIINNAARNDVEYLNAFFYGVRHESNFSLLLLDNKIHFLVVSEASSEVLCSSSHADLGICISASCLLKCTPHRVFWRPGTGFAGQKQNSPQFTH